MGAVLLRSFQVDSTKVTKLLIAAMQRHITWPNVKEIGSLVPKGWTPFYIKEDLSYQPPFSDVNPYARTYIKYPLKAFADAIENHTEMTFSMWGGKIEPPTIKHGAYLLMNVPDTKDIHPYTVYMPEEVSSDEQGRITHDYSALELVIASSAKAHEDKDQNGNIRTLVDEIELELRFVSFFEILVLMAAQDAEKAGRDKDVEALIKLIPHDYGTSLTEEQEAAILAHVGEKQPNIIRGGSKTWTDLMGMSANPRNNMFEVNEKMAAKGIAPLGVAFTIAGADERLVIFANEPGKALSVDAGTSKLLSQLNMLFTKRGQRATESGGFDIVTSYEELLSQRELPVTRGNKRSIKGQIETLNDASFTIVTDEIKDGNIGIIANRFYHRRGGKVSINLDPAFVRIVLGRNAGEVPLDEVLYSTDDIKHPHAWAIGNRLNSHSYMNYEKDTRYRISVKKLLANVKSIPSIEKLLAAGVRGDANHTKRIIEPMERDLEHLKEIGFLEDWDYAHANGEPLTPSEQDMRINPKLDGPDLPLPYSIAKDCLITWTPTHDYIGQMQVITDSRERKKKRDKEERAAKVLEMERKKKRIERKTEAEIAKKRAEAEV